MLPKIILAAAIVISLISTVLLIHQDKKDTSSEKPIVFLGNSITAGQGAKAGEDFPTLIAKALNVPVINSGVSGDTTSDALQRIHNDVLDKNPSIVVVELGGNDLLSSENKATTIQNFELILSKIKQTNAKIVVLGTKFIIFNKVYETDWASLAKKYDAIYVPDILDGILTDPNLKFDDIHPNAKGYQKIADKLIPIIAPLILQ